jgi:hypothetical protein
MNERALLQRWLDTYRHSEFDHAVVKDGRYCEQCKLRRETKEMLRKLEPDRSKLKVESYQTKIRGAYTQWFTVDAQTYLKHRCDAKYETRVRYVDA